MAEGGSNLKQLAWSGGFIAAAVIAEVCGAGGGGAMLASVAGSLLSVAAGNVGGGMLQELFGKHQAAIAERSKDPRSHVHNHDLRSLTGRTIALCVAIAAKEYKGSGAGAEFLARLSGKLGEGWAAHASEAQYKGVAEESLTRFFEGHAKDGELPTALTPTLWEQLIGRIADDADIPPDQDALEFAAGVLHERFARVVIELAKADFAPGETGSPHDGKAFAALLLGLLRDVTGDLSYLVKSAEVAAARDAHVLAVLQDVQTRVKDRYTAVMRLAPEDIAAIVNPITREFNRLSAELANQFGPLFDSLTQVHATLAALPAAFAKEAAALMQAGLDPRASARAPLFPTVLRARNPRFRGREVQLAALRTALSKGTDVGYTQDQALHASGGVGKTALAGEYAWRFLQQYPGGVFFLSAAEGAIDAQIARWADSLGLTREKDDAGTAARVRAFLRHRADAAGENRPVLILIDNVDGKEHWDSNEWRESLPPPPVRRLFTTRAARLGDTPMKRLDRLDDGDGLAMLRAYRDFVDGSPDAAAARGIVQWFGGWAVGLATVGARMLMEDPPTWADLAGSLTGLKLGAVELVERDLIDAGQGARPLADYAQRIDAALEDTISRLGELERLALEFAALLPQDTAPEVWLVWLVEQNHAQGKAATLTPGWDQAQAAVERLNRLGLLERAEEDSPMFVLHAVRREYVAGAVGAVEGRAAALWSAIAACAKARYGVIVGRDASGEYRGLNNPAALTDQSLRWELTPLAAACTALWEGGEPGAAAGIGVWLAPVLRLLGRFAEAAACLLPVRKHEAAVEQAVGPEDLSHCYSNHAMIQHDQGDLPGARASMERAIAIAEKNLGAEHPTLATMHSNLSIIQRDQGDLPGARASMGRAIAMKEKHLTPDHPTFGISYSNLGLIQQDQGDLPGARASMERAIAINVEHFAPDHPTFAIRYNNLAMILKDLSEFDEALRYKLLSMKIERQSLGEDHPQMGTSYSNLALIQEAQGDLLGARASIERAIAVDGKHFAPDHPNFAIRYANLGGIEHAEGKKAAACASFRRALAILLKNFGEDHPHTKRVRGWMDKAGCPS